MGLQQWTHTFILWRQIQIWDWNLSLEMRSRIPTWIRIQFSGFTLWLCDYDLKLVCYKHTICKKSRCILKKHNTKHKIYKKSRCISKEGEPLHGGICHRFYKLILATHKLELLLMLLPQTLTAHTSVLFLNKPWLPICACHSNDTKAIWESSLIKEWYFFEIRSCLTNFCWIYGGEELLIFGGL